MSKELEKDLKGIINKLSQNFDLYEFYNTVLFNGEEIMNMVFRDYISDVEGSPCCADKSGFIVRRIKRALKERKNIPLCQTYAEYRNNGGDLGGINETNTDMDTICYWCPKTIKDTDAAIELYFSLLNVPRYLRSMSKEKIKELDQANERWEKLKEWVGKQSFQHDQGYRTVVFKDELQQKMQELERIEKKLKRYKRSRK